MFVNNTIIINFGVCVGNNIIVDSEIVGSKCKMRTYTRKFTEKRTRTVPNHQTRKGIAPRRLFLYGCQKLNKLKSLRYVRFPEIIQIRRWLSINTAAQ